MLEKVQNKRIEMVWFGGIAHDLSDCVFHVTLKLDLAALDAPDAARGPHDNTTKLGGHLHVKKLRNNSGKLVKLAKQDRFFYN